jgi:type II secretory pathway predicted ATPase ExeA
MRDWGPLLVAICALLGAVYAGRVSTRATRVNQEANQIKWLSDARSEAVSIRKDLDAATDELAETKRETKQTKAEAVELRDLIEELTRWVMRVVDWAHDETVDGPELRRLINGGPPSMRGTIGRGKPGSAGGGWSREEGKR